MKQLFTSVMLLFFALEAKALCVQNFNVYGTAYAPQVRARAYQTAQELLKRPCDLLIFQEAWTARSYEPLEALLKSHYPYQSQQHQRFRMGLIKFSKNQVLDEKLYGFRVNYTGGILDRARKIAGVQKGFLIQKIKNQEAEPLFVVNTHLHPSSQAIRLTQILDLLSWRVLNLNHDWVLAGDFNANPNSLEISLAKAVLKVKDSGLEFFNGKYPNDFCTYCADNPIGWLGSNQIFDYIFVGEANNRKYQWMPQQFSKNLDQFGSQVLSDHAGIRTQLQKDYLKGPHQTLEKDLLISLDEALKVLSRAPDEEFQPYQRYLHVLKKQILDRQGPFYDYFDPK